MATSPSIRMGRSEFIRLTEAALRAGFGQPNATAIAVEVQAEADRRFGSLKELADAEDADQAERLDKSASTLASGVKKFVSEIRETYGDAVLSKIFDGIPTVDVPEGTKDGAPAAEPDPNPYNEVVTSARAPKDERLSQLAGMTRR